MKTNLSLLMGLLAAGTFAPATALAQTSCPEIGAMVDRALPTTVGDESFMQRLLDARPSSQLSRNFNPAAGLHLQALQPHGSRRGVSRLCLLR
jgi:hypothetical protein